MKRKKFFSFFQKIRFKYRVSILNENTLEESWHIHLSRLSVFIYLFVFTIITFALLSVLIFVTPLHQYLPGYGDMNLRSKIIQESIRADSLTHAMNLQAAYLEIVKDIIKGNIKPDSVVGVDSAFLQQQAQKLIETSKREKEFTKKFEEEEKFNFTSMESSSTNKKTLVFFRPATGNIVSSFNISKKQYGVALQTLPDAAVSSVLNGIVVFADFTFDNQWVIAVQHEDNYLSIYKNNNRLLKNIGEVVRTGEPIAITGSSKGKNGQLYFELWQQGKPINPQNIIIF